MRSLFCFILALPSFIGAMDLAPWTGVDLEFHPRITNILETYPSHTNYLLGLGVEGSYDIWQADLEVNIAKTNHRELSFDDIRLTGRYRWMDDIVGLDPVSVYLGLTYIQTNHHSLNDPNLFHHGTGELEVHVAVGKEWSYLENWITHLWGVGVIGMANHGYPWLRADFALEKNWCDDHGVALFVNTLWGLGYKSLHTHDFHGYGSIRHQSVDLGINYNSIFVCGSTLTFGYSYRVYALNFPSHVNTYMINLMMPFGL